MLNSAAGDVAFIEHAFWRYLDIRSNCVLFDQLPGFSTEKRRELLSLVIEGFYPISYCSPTAFLRYAALSENTESSAIAQEIGEIELGKHPLLPGSTFKNIWHCKQLKLLVESLEPDFVSDLPEPFEIELWKNTDLENADIMKAAAVCEIIENTAPQVINYYADFVASWQFVFKINTGKLQRNYLDEHGLTEGDSHEGQHISLINNMLKPLGELTESAEYKNHGMVFNSMCCKHLGKVQSKIESLLN